MSQTEVQLIKDAVIVNADVSGSAAIDVSKISGAMPLAGGSFTDDVTFTGASANIVFDKSDNSLEFADDAMATFGGSADLRIRHNGNNSLIEDMGTGNLQIRGDDVHITGTNDEILAKFIENTGVELYHDGSSKKFETTSTGATVTGNLLATGIFQNDTGGEGLHNTATGGKFYSNSSSETRLEHGSNAQIKLSFIGSSSTYRGAVSADANGIHLLSGASGEQIAVKCIADGATELRHSGSKKFETTSTGTSFTAGTAVINGPSSTSYSLDVLPLVNTPYGVRVKQPASVSNGYPLLAVTEDGGATLFRVLSGTGVAETRTMQPVTDNTYDLGTASKRYANIFTTDLKLSNEGSQNDVDSTWGNYTIQEGHEDLFLLNHRTGKKFKFNLTEVS